MQQEHLGKVLAVKLLSKTTDLINSCQMFVLQIFCICKLVLARIELDALFSPTFFKNNFVVYRN